jgi:putative salt-induced outer membrane protein
MMQRPWCVLVCLWTSPVLVSAVEPSTKTWSNDTEVSLVNATGNSRTQTLKADDHFKKEWTKTLLEMQGSALGSSDRNTVTAEEYTASEKVGWKFTERDYLLQNEAWDKNRFAGLRTHVESTGGYGRKLIDGTIHKLTAEIGSGYINEDRTDGSKNDYAIGRAFSEYAVHLSSTAVFSQNIEYLPKLQDASDYRLNTETALIASIATHLSLKVSYDWKRASRPPAGFGRDDTLTSAALVVNY